MQTLYGYQVKPGSDDTLFFALTLKDCQEAALKQRREMREEIGCRDIDAMAVYECLFRIDLISLLELLNAPEGAYEKVLLSKTLIRVVAD